MNPLLNWPQKAQKGPWDLLPRVGPRNSKKRGAGGLQPPWGHGPPMPKSAPPPKSAPLPPARGVWGPPARPAAHSPAAASTHSPPARPAPAAGSLCRPAGPPPPSAGWRAGVAGLPACVLEGGSSPAPAAPTRAYTPIPPYTRVWVCVRGCVGVHVSVHMHTYATHRLPEQAQRLFLLQHNTPPYPQHNRCRRPHCRAMRLFLAPRIRHISMEK